MNDNRRRVFHDWSRVHVPTLNADDGQWITVSGTHVLVKDGEIVGGPAALVGKGKKDDGDGGHTHSSVKARVDTLVKKILATEGRHDKSHGPESDKIMADLKSAIPKMSKTEMAHEIGVPSTAKSWPREKLEKAVFKASSDRLGAAFRANI